MKTNLSILFIAALLLAGLTAATAQTPQSLPATLPGTGQVNPIPVSTTVTGKLTTERIYRGSAYTATEHHYDGLGREVRTVAVDASPTGGDIVSERVFDCMGRGDSILWLPYVPDSLGRTLPTPQQRVTRFYRQMLGSDPDASFAATRTQYDASPLSLAVATDQPGLNHSLASASGHPVRFDYRLNDHNQVVVRPLATAPVAGNAVLLPARSDRVKAYRITGDSLLLYQGIHPAGRLLVREKTSQSTDTVRITVLEYLDPEEHLVAKEIRVNDRSEHFTYYVYDDKGKLRYEIPSIQDKLITATGKTYKPSELGKYATYHGYDARGNEILTLRPGRERIERIYDDRDREVLTQDGNQRSEGRWLYVKYDDYGRVLETHLLTSRFPASYLANKLRDLSGAALHEALAGLVLHDVLLTQVHYDGYEDYDLAPAAAEGERPKRYRSFGMPDELAFVPVVGVVTADALHPNNTGLKTYEKIAVLPDALTDTAAYIERAFYYDKDGLLVQTVVHNHLGGINRLSSKYDEAGNELVRHESRTTGPGAAPTVVQTRSSYDDFGRLLFEQTRLGSGPIASVRYRYDALGRIERMIQGSGKIDTRYTYDIVGRMTSQQNELFRMTLVTDKPSLSGVQKRFDGQIGQCLWAHAGDGSVSGYAYRYTPLGQLQDARRYRDGQVQVATYAETGLTYDDNDNILSLTRYGNKRIDNAIRYRYDGNRLVATFDNGRTTTYGYDLNGNVISTSENACSYRYNYLNLVEEVQRNGTLAARYKYLADGTKLEVSDALGGGYLYFGSLIYHKLGDRYEPESVGFNGGRIVGTTSGSQVRYHVTDYLGSVRVVADAEGKRLEKCDYYPFGKRIEEAEQPLASNRYLFNGKEWQATGGVNLLDYGARMYDPNLGRWFCQDPLYQVHNPYTFCSSDPVNRIDPNGMDYYFSRGGDYLFQDDAATDFIRILDDMDPDLLKYLEGLFGFDSSKLHAYSSFFSKVELPDEAVEKIYTWIFSNFFPEFVNIPVKIGTNMSEDVLMTTTGHINHTKNQIDDLHIDINHTPKGMLFDLNGTAIADNLYCILNVFDHEGNHLKGWMGNPNEYYNNDEAYQEVNAYLYQMISSIYWQKVPNDFKSRIYSAYLKFLNKL